MIQGNDLIELQLTCLDCKHHTHWYEPPSMGEGEPDLEFYCNHPCVALDYEGEITEKDLELIAEKCSFYELG